MKNITCSIIVSLLILAGCSDTSTNFNEVELNKEFNLQLGDSAILANQGLVIKFKTVSEDSRCPIGLRCFWAGNATVVLELKSSGADMHTVELKTYLDPKYVEFSDLIIILNDLNPYPKQDEIINPPDYVAKLVVKNKEN